MESKDTNQVLNLDSFSYNSINPFINQIMLHITENKTSATASAVGTKEVLNEKTGELEPMKMLFLKKITKITDHQEFCKVYLGSFKHFFHLPNSAVNLLEYIMTNIQYGSDRICLHVATVVDETGFTKSGIYKSIIKLLSANIIAKADKRNCYFINPSVLFKGERITLINEFVNASGIEFEKTTKKIKNGTVPKNI